MRSVQDSLQKDLLHHVVQGAVQGRVIEQRAGRAKPAVEVHHLVVCIYVVELRNLSDPPNHHAFQDSTGYTGGKTGKPGSQHSKPASTNNWRVKVMVLYLKVLEQSAVSS